MTKEPDDKKNLLHFTLVQERVHLKEVGLEQAKQFYTRQDLQLKFLERV